MGLISSLGCAYVKLVSVVEGFCLSGEQATTQLALRLGLPYVTPVSNASTTNLATYPV